ncbi:RPM1-interacting protein 4-like isoform X2 [Lycium barbarum]|uniref:RPM1-interacting protein 4-like isoform X1 n=1 Tax=Lycium barbarum TaxID=112863 RepID=UPI00293EAA0C|nr:RPM1-interacting protein 4-like isoform X1 [Lycium barbarum]XP_060173867.1 RPM1-interacting protein 4-like isoform X2 [Lycium barbarum]
MAKHSQVPKFGDWESDEDVQYSIVFENAAKGKKGSKMNPNDPQDLDAKVKGENGSNAVRQKPERFASRDDVEMRKSTDRAPTYSSPQRHGEKSGGRKSESETMKGPEIPRHERRPSREEGYLRKPTDSPLRNENMGRRTPMESPHHRYGGLSGGATPKRASQQSVGPDRSIEHSPLHPHGRAGGKGGVVSSPSWERKTSSEGSHGLAPSTPGRSRLRSVTKGDDTPDDSPAVPKFGDWDENDPASAEGYTQIFNKVREEKQTGAAKVPASSNDSSYSNSQKRYGNDSGKGCLCFPWGRS